jgi:hypothetical protein
VIGVAGCWTPATCWVVAGDAELSAIPPYDPSATTAAPEATQIARRVTFIRPSSFSPDMGVGVVWSTNDGG